MQVREFQNTPEDWKLIHDICYNCGSKILKRTYGYLQRINFLSGDKFFCDVFNETAFFAGIKAKTHARCLAVAVSSENQLKGLGRQILHYEMDKLRYIGIDAITLRANMNEQAKIFWLKMGAKIVGRKGRRLGNETSILKLDYQSPRWSNEIFDCSMPMTLDTYNQCSYHCLYCFAFYQKSHTCSGYDGNKKKNFEIRSVNPEKIITIFEGALKNNKENISLSQLQFFPYIQARRIMQWGGLADCFDEWERRFGITLELLKYFDSIDYPLSFSTKAAWWTKDARYIELFRKHTHNWHVKISIITADKIKARLIEKGVPSPEQRLEAIKRLSDIGIHVTLRLRPYIIGVSGDWKELIFQAHKAGADSVTTEFFCMEQRADEKLKRRYEEISEVCNFDIYKFCNDYSSQQGYKRLDRKIKMPIIYEMRNFTNSLGMRFYVSDAHCRECNVSCNCCGVPPEWNVSQEGHIGQAIIIAREKGFVRYSDIADKLNVFGNLRFKDMFGFNQNNTSTRARNYYMTVKDFVRNNWNNIKSGTSPARMYGGILIPYDVDDNGDVVYKFNEEIWRRNAEKS